MVYIAYYGLQSRGEVMQQTLLNRKSLLLIVLLIINVLFILLAYSRQLFFILDLNQYQAGVVIASGCAIFGAISVIAGIWAIIQYKRGKKQYVWPLGLALVISGTGVTALFLGNLFMLMLAYACGHNGQCL